MIYLNAGNLWTNDYLDKVIELNEQHKDDEIQVKALFGSIAKLTPTARSADRLPYLEWSMIDKYVDKAQKNGIKIRYTLNASCLGSMQDFRQLWEGKLKADIVELHAIGITEWTVTSPLLLIQLRELFPDDLLEVSTIAEVDTLADVLRWMGLGANGFNLATKTNRDFDVIEEIVTSGAEISILANEACLYRCPYRRDCYNLSSHNSERGEELFDFYPFRWCNIARMGNIVEWIQARVVLPQWMHLYQDHGIDWFKIAYRTHPYEVAIPILELYMNKYHGGNYLDLWPTIKRLGDTEEPADKQYISCEELDRLSFIQYFMRNGSKCDHNICGVTCLYCDSVIKKAQVHKDA